MNVAIASTAGGDLPVVLDLLGRCNLPQAGLEQHLATTLVAREGVRIVGCAALELYGRAALLRSVAVEPSSRGLGLGAQLTHAALDLARAHAVQTVYLLTDTASVFFLRFGFHRLLRTDVDPPVQRSAEFTGACPQSALAMRADLA